MPTPSFAVSGGRHPREGLRWLDPARHPLLATMGREAVYDYGRFMAPGGHLLIDLVGRTLGLQPGARVLDLGCGRGQSSVWFARMYGAEVVSVDLWVSAAERDSAARAAGVAGQVSSYQGDIRRGLPSGTAPFDAIVAVQSFHSFGTNPAILRYLSTLLRPGAPLVIAQTCFTDAPRILPAVFQDTGGRYAEYDKYHDPLWWSSYLGSTDVFEVEHCAELLDGDIFWEDDMLTRGARAGWTVAFIEENSWLIRQLMSGREGSTRLTHFLAVARS